MIVNPAVFISYCREDKGVAEAVVARLESAGLGCWIAPRNVRPGENWGGAIIKAITGARVMVLIFSRHTNDSPHVMNEIERAVSRRVTIIPFRLEEVKPSEDLELFISSCHWLNAFPPPLEPHLAELVTAVGTVLGVEASAQTHAPEPAPPPKSAVPWLAAIAALVVVSVAAAFLLLHEPASPHADSPVPAASTTEDAVARTDPPPPAEPPAPDPLREARELEDTQDFIGALAVYADLLATDPTQSDIRLRAGNAIARIQENADITDSDGRIEAASRRLAAADLPAAQNLLGILLRRRNPEESLGFFKEAAAHGHARAMAEVGLMLSNGDGAPRDLAQAAAWLKRSAEAGSTEGMILYAECLLGGKGVVVNEAEAASLYTQAAALGSLPAKVHLARMYQKGIGMPAPDAKEAYRLYQEAADQGFIEAQGRLGAMYMSGEAGVTDPQKAVQLWQDGARKDDAVCMLFYAMSLENGALGPPDKGEASVWYQRAARKGNADAVKWCVANDISF